MSKTSYSVAEIRQLFGLSERTIRRWTETGVIQSLPTSEGGEFTYDFQALTQFSRVREMRLRGLTIKQIEVELLGQLSFSKAESIESEDFSGFTTNYDYFLQQIDSPGETPIPAPKDANIVARLPHNAEYILYLLLPTDERDVVIGDLIEDYGRVLARFGKRRADVWLYKQIIGSVWPLLQRALLKVGALVWLGRVLRRLIS